MGDSGIANKIDQAEAIYIPSIAVGEMYYGAQYSTQIEKNIENITQLTERFQVLHIDVFTATQYGIIKASLRRKGKPIPENDIWISAIAQQYSLPLVTRDKHFKEIDSIVIMEW